MRLSRRLAAGLLLVAVGRLLSPAAVPVYDGIGQPDEPYRYVSPPAGATKTAAPTSAKASSPLVGGVSTDGMQPATGEIGPQFSLFIPPKGLRAAGTRVAVTIVPLVPTGTVSGATFDGNEYRVSFTASGPVALTPQAALATMYLRATTPKQPPPVMQYRASEAAPWTALRTSRGGQDVYVSAFPGPGFYALAFPVLTKKSPAGSSPVPFIVLGGVVLLAVVVVVVRLRAAS